MAKVKSTLKEKLFYGFGNMGSYILWAFVSTYITEYVTDVAKFPSDILATLGTIILVCRFFDGASDIVMGLLIEKTNSKLGKARFWYGISIIPMTVTFVLMFSFSGLDNISFLVLISVLYFLFAVVF